VQYADWALGLLRGDMGTSYFRSGVSISATIVEKGRLTAQIALIGILVAWLFAVPLGVASAVRRNSVVGYLCRLAASSWRLFSSIARYSRAFWIATAAWVGNVCSRLTVEARNSPAVFRRTTSAPTIVSSRKIGMARISRKPAWAKASPST
jgi:ABC-type dipeptide/oligopeptide/nickel transport system permease component